MKKIIFFCLLINIQNAFSQSSAVDSLLQKLNAEKNDDTRIDMFNDFVGVIAETDPVLDMQNSQDILLHAQTNNDHIIEAMALSQIAYDYRAFGNTSMSLEYNLEATLLAAETGNEKLINNTNLNLAHIYKDQADYTKAIKSYNTVGASCERSKDYLVQCWVFGSLAQVYTEMNILDSALIFAQRAYELSNHDKSYISGILKLLGTIHGKLGNSALAVSYFNMAIEEGYKTNSPRWVNEAYTAIAQYYYDVGKVDSSLVYAKKAIAAVQKTAFSNKSIRSARLLLDIYKNNNSDSALKYSEIYRIANDSLFNLKTIQHTQAFAFENELNQKELAEEKIKAENHRKQNIQFAFIAFGIISFIVLFLLLSRSIIVTEKWVSFFGVLGLLVVFEFINLLIHPTLASLTRESPILMLLALVAIAALLIPMHHNLEKWTTYKLVEKNKAIRLANAKKTIAKLEGNSTNEGS